MKPELEQFKQETGYLPGQIELALKWGNTADFELYMLVDDVIARMQQYDDASANERAFIDRFSAQVNTYFGS
jgi:hypothetical protein